MPTFHTGGGQRDTMNSVLSAGAGIWCYHKKATGVFAAKQRACLQGRRARSLLAAGPPPAASVWRDKAKVVIVYDRRDARADGGDTAESGPTPGDAPTTTAPPYVPLVQKQNKQTKNGKAADAFKRAPGLERIPGIFSEL